MPVNKIVDCRNLQSTVNKLTILTIIGKNLSASFGMVDNKFNFVSYRSIS